MRILPGALCLLSVLLAGQEPGKLSVETLYHPVQRTSYVEAPVSRFVWCPDGSLLEERAAEGADFQIVRVDLRGAHPRPLSDRAQLAAALAQAGVPAPAVPGALANRVWNPAMDAFLADVAGQLYLVELAGKVRARRLTDAPGPQEAPLFSPDGSRVAYLRGQDLYVAEVATGKETRLTQGGDDNHLNGRLDWVYQEEVFERGNFRAFWWAPDSRRLAFLSLDETRVPSFTLADDRTHPQKLVTYRYPKPGEPNPVARLGVVDLQGRVAWMADPYPGQQTLVVQVGWDPAGRLLANYQDRIQSWLECRRFEDGQGKLLVREESRAWVEHLPLPHFLQDGSWIWKSARTGFHHLYLYDAQGRLQRPLTQGEWDVKTLHGVDGKRGVFYFDGTFRSPIGLDAFRADLRAQAPNAGLRRLTDKPGTHSVTFGPGFKGILDRWSAADTPTRMAVLDIEGKCLHEVESRISGAFKALPPLRLSFQKVKTRDGFPMETMLVLPPAFDPSRKYPVFHYVYGGPGSPLVRDAWNRATLWFQFLAQQGIVTWICDNRSASAKGVQSAHGIHRNLGAQELQDQLDGLAWLRSQGWADMDRIALHGYSFGGYFTAYALTRSKAWKLGIIGAPVVDWRLYDSVYTERFMGLPQDNPEGYRASSALAKAAELKGKVMFLHGTLDDNVHPQNTIQFLDALEKAGLTAPLILMPGSGHSPNAPQHAWAMYGGMWEFLKENL